MSGKCVVASGRDFQLADPEAFRSTARAVVDYARRLSPAFAKISSLARLQVIADGGDIGAAKDQHTAVCALLDCLKQASSQEPTGPDEYLFVGKCSEYDRYIDKFAVRQGANSRIEWANDAVRSNDNAVLAQAIDEIVSHMRAFGEPAQHYQGFAAYAQARLDALLPPEIMEVHQETNLALVVPMFEKSLSVPGDAAEFGCFRGALAVKLAWMMKAAGAPKHYYAFDTFQASEIDDPVGSGDGLLGAGAFRDNADAYDALTKWSRLLPLTPIKGDPPKTCSVLTKPLSFVWLDLERDVLMDPVLRHIWPLCSSDTIIGIDDAGRPENPTVGPWLDQLVATGALELVLDSNAFVPGVFVRFLKKKKVDFPTGLVGAWRSQLRQQKGHSRVTR